MKKLFILLGVAVMAHLSLSAQTPELPIVDGRINYTAVITVDNILSKSDLYTRARQWFAKTYKSASSVIQMEDRESGTIVGKALMQVHHKAMGGLVESGHISYTLSVYVKDGRYKYEITDFHHTGQLIRGGNRIPDYGACEDMINTTRKTMGISYQKTFDFYLEQMRDNITYLIADLNSTMKQPQNNINDNW